jgi:glycerate-2-kinase
MKIKNFGELATNPLRTSALKIVEAGLLSIDTVEVLRENISVFGEALTISNETIILPEKSRIFVVGVGKCATDAAFVLEEILGDRIYKGMVIDIKCDPRLC